MQILSNIRRDREEKKTHPTPGFEPQITRHTYTQTVTQIAMYTCNAHAKLKTQHYFNTHRKYSQEVHTYTNKQTDVTHGLAGIIS